MTLESMWKWLCSPFQPSVQDQLINVASRIRNLDTDIWIREEQARNIGVPTNALYKDHQHYIDELNRLQELKRELRKKLLEEHEPRID